MGNYDALYTGFSQYCRDSVSLAIFAYYLNSDSQC